jgi:hypothetical protein
VKRGIGEIWRYTDRPPYKDIFNEGTTSVHVWKAVSIMRAVDEELHRHKNELAAVHLSRALLHVVFQDPEVRDFRRDDLTEEIVVEKARKVINAIFPRTLEYINEKHPNEYMGVFCKNAPKCKSLARVLMRARESTANSGVVSYTEQLDMLKDD